MKSMKHHGKMFLYSEVKQQNAILEGNSNKNEGKNAQEKSNYPKTLIMTESK